MIGQSTRHCHDQSINYHLIVVNVLSSMITRNERFPKTPARTVTQRSLSFMLLADSACSHFRVSADDFHDRFWLSWDARVPISRLSGISYSWLYIASVARPFLPIQVSSYAFPLLLYLRSRANYRVFHGSPPWFGITIMTRPCLSLAGQGSLGQHCSTGSCPNRHRSISMCYAGEGLR